jgi:hypothetical protein
MDYMNNMFRLLLYMHHIAFCTPCIVHLNLDSYLCIYARSRGAKIRSSVQAEQAQVEAITNLFLSMASLGASHTILDFYFELISLC